jgi:malate permease and related proteins
VINVAKLTGDAAVPLILLLIGATLYGSRRVDHLRDLSYLTLLRLVVLPAATILLLRGLPLARETYALAVIVALMPCSSTSPIMTRRYGGSPVYAGHAAFFTTLCSIATVPLLLWLLG